MVCLAELLLASVLRPAAQEVAGEASFSASSTSFQGYTIPDGTTVQLRFAEALRGKMPKNYCKDKIHNCRLGLPDQALPNQAVRLVVAADVRSNGLLVIAKGANAQATITKVHKTLYDYTGLVLKFDWVEDVTGGRIPLRESQRGKPEPIDVAVKEVTGGMMARRWTRVTEFSRLLLPPLDRKIGMLAWIPVGTRILGFVQGDFALDEEAVRRAQALLPASSDNALLTIYRTKGHDELRPAIVCDGKELPAIAPQQYTLLELEPQKHTCLVEREQPVEITAQAGEEYFLRLHYGALAGSWKLELVSVPEGEDEVLNFKPLETK